MARRKKHAEHTNHEAWAIPYGDLVTLLLAFFVVMYSISSVNEGTYRVLSDSLSAAFRGAPRSLEPIQVGDPSPPVTEQARIDSVPRSLRDPSILQRPEDFLEDLFSEQLGVEAGRQLWPLPEAESVRARNVEEGLQMMADQVRDALGDLIADDRVKVRENPLWLEIELQTDILFPIGVADFSEDARPILQQLADIMTPFPNPIRVEGHTDNVPIATVRFPSNWELSAARAASVVRLFENQGIDAIRLAAIGLGEHRPIASNDSAQGRNQNRRVMIVVMATDQAPPDLGGRRDLAMNDSDARFSNGEVP